MSNHLKYQNEQKGQFTHYLVRRKWWYRWFGFPIYTVDYDGEVRLRRAKPLPNGGIVTERIHGKIIGNPDGTFPDSSYVRSWFPR